jgi:hypothetical protein
MKTLPWLVPVLRVGGAFHLDTLKMYVPWGQYIVWERYVADDSFAWGHQFQGFSVEISRVLLGVTLLGESLDPRQWIGVALMGVGAVLLALR